jgi:hypothetical protein
LGRPDECREEFNVARRSILVAVAVMIVASWPAGAPAATAPSAPQLASEPYASPVTLRWTPASDVLNTSQALYGLPGACTTPVTAGELIAGNLGNSTNTFIVSPAGDGTFCYYIKVTDLTGAAADSPGVTVVVDRASPIATIAVLGQTAGLVAGTVTVSATSADAGSGVAASVLHVGAVGACPGGPVLGSVWDTTAYANSAYDVCNIVTDNAGHSATATVTVTVVNAPPPAAVVPAVRKLDKVSPRAPTKLAVSLVRSRKARARLYLRLRWVNPTASDLDRVVVVLNPRRAPRSAADGRVLYRGLGTTVTLKLRARHKSNMALFAYDHSGNVSRAVRRVLVLTSSTALRPLSGSVLRKAPRLTWRAKTGAVYYNLQIFRKGKRVLVAWPARASYRLRPGKLVRGTYVWFVWPALEREHARPRFGELIGRATFVYKG